VTPSPESTPPDGTTVPPMTPAPTPSAPPAAPEATDPDPDAGAKKALDAERKARRDAESAAKRLESEIAELRKSQMTDQEKALDDARTEARTEVETRLRERLLSAEVRARVAGRSIDPDLVATLVDRKSLKWDGDDVDVESLERQISKILEAKPYLALSDQPGTPAPPRVPTGPRGNKQAGTITRSDLHRMTPEDITAAFKRGELSHLMAPES
jgi:hypothetical protein